MDTTKRCIATVIVLMLCLQLHTSADARRLSSGGGEIRLPSDGKDDPTAQVGASKLIKIDDSFYTSCPDGMVLECIFIASAPFCKCVPKNGAGLTDGSMLPSDGRDDPTAQVGASKLIKIDDSFYTSCPDGMVLECIIIASAPFCKCVPKNGAGLTDGSMSSTANKPGNKD
ncbi:hypothetical protein D1007_55595 [Hordeum vulgare]|nr:hypothetical protein D1007_55595 [Hordeum vulgare]